MGIFVDRTKTHRISLEPLAREMNDPELADKWFDIRVERSRADTLALGDALISWQLDGTDLVGHQHSQEQFTKLLERTIVRWNFIGPDGLLAPLNAAAMEDIGDEIGKWMGAQIDAFYRRYDRENADRPNSLTAPWPGISAPPAHDSPPSSLISWSPDGFPSATPTTLPSSASGHTAAS